MTDPEHLSMTTEAMCQEYPEVRVHLAHLRAIHQQRISGVNQPVLAKLKVKKVPKDGLVPVQLKLSPEVLAAFKSTGTGWQKRINEVLMTLVGKGKG